MRKAKLEAGQLLLEILEEDPSESDKLEIDSKSHDSCNGLVKYKVCVKLCDSV